VLSRKFNVRTLAWLFACSTAPPPSISNGGGAVEQGLASS
jgi:hypothetical protein